MDFLRRALDDVAPWVVSGSAWDASFLRELVDGDAQRPGLVDLCGQEVGAGDVSILLELRRYRARSDVPSGLPVRLWTLDLGLRAYA